MADPRDAELIKPFNGDPFTGHLATPISASDFTKAFIGNLPIYRKGLSPLVRGLEIGLAHGYFLVGPEIVFGPLRDYEEAANLGGLIYSPRLSSARHTRYVCLRFSLFQTRQHQLP